jgi:hypothetical protein
MSIEAMRQARNAFVWNLNTDLDNIPACEQWANMLRKNIDALDKALADAKRTWVGLTNDEVNNLAAGCHLGNSVQGAIYKAEAKLKQKKAMPRRRTHEDTWHRPRFNRGIGNAGRRPTHRMDGDAHLRRWLP